MPGLGADEASVGGVEADCALDHLLGAWNVGAGEVDLVDHGNDFEAVIDGQVGVCKSLGFDPLGGIHDEECAFAGGKSAGHFVGKIHVARRIDEVQLIDFAILGGVHHADGVRLDRDAAFAFKIHGIKDLLLHLAHGERPGEFQQAVGQRGFSMVNVGDDREVADVGCFHDGRANP